MVLVGGEATGSGWGKTWWRWMGLIDAEGVVMAAVVVVVVGVVGKCCGWGEGSCVEGRGD